MGFSVFGLIHGVEEKLSQDAGSANYIGSKNAPDELLLWCVRLLELVVIFTDLWETDSGISIALRFRRNLTRLPSQQVLIKVRMHVKKLMKTCKSDKGRWRLEADLKTLEEVTIEPLSHNPLDGSNQL